MNEPAAKISKTKLILAGVGVIYLVGFAAWGAYTLLNRPKQSTTPNMAAHPEMAAEILAEREMEKYAEKLGLNDGQKEQVRAMIKESGITGGQGRPGPEGMRGMHDLMNKVRAILTPEQLEKMDAEQKDRAGKMADRFVDRIKEQVGISDEQAAKIKEIMIAANPMRGGGGPGAAPEGGDPRNRFEKIRTQIRELLSPDQQAKFDKMRMGPMGGGRGGGRDRGQGRPPQEEQ